MGVCVQENKWNYIVADSNSLNIIINVQREKLLMWHFWVNEKSLYFTWIQQHGTLAVTMWDSMV